MIITKNPRPKRGSKYFVVGDIIIAKVIRNTLFMLPGYKCYEVQIFNSFKNLDFTKVRYVKELWK